MMIKQVSFSYNQTNGTGLPGFKPSSRYLGMDDAQDMAPGLAFVSGMNDSILRKSITNDWLVKNPNQSLPYTNTKATTITYRANVEPHGSLKIEFNGTRTHSYNQSTFIRYDTSLTGSAENNHYRFGTPTNSGNYSISVFSLAKSFTDKNNKTGASTLFNEFLENREAVAIDLASSNIGFVKCT